jgi:hypothetical protein
VTPVSSRGPKRSAANLPDGRAVENAVGDCGFLSVSNVFGQLDARLREWKPETAAEARERIAEVIELADHDILDIARSRAAEQEVLDLLDEPPTR